MIVFGLVALYDLIVINLQILGFELNWYYDEFRLDGLVRSTSYLTIYDFLYLKGHLHSNSNCRYLRCGYMAS